MVMQARAEEVKYVQQMKLYKKVPVSTCKQVTGKAPIQTRWIDTNKGDEKNPQYRSRLVAKEIKRDNRPDLFAATPPLEALRMVISCAASEGAYESRWRLMTNDVSRAYFYAPATRRICVQLPQEDRGPGDEGKCGELQFSMYGTRDAAMNWSDTYAQHLQQLGFERGIASPCLFWHAEKRLKTLVHGDDCVTAGPKDSLLWMKKQLERKFEIKTKILGPGPGEEKSITILNRILEWTHEGISYEADARHAEQIVRELGMCKAKEVVTPGIREDEPTEEERQETPLEGAAAAQYRAITARANYLALDRPGLGFAVKELTRRMAVPAEHDVVKLKRVGRYLRGAPRATIIFKWQEPPRDLDGYTDADWAGCRTTRKSTSGGRYSEGSIR